MADPHEKPHRRWAMGLAVLLHLAAAGLIMLAPNPALRKPVPPPEDTVVYLVEPPPAEPPQVKPEPPEPPEPAPPPAPVAPDLSTASASAPEPAEPQPGPAYMDAPPAPSAQEWAQAATYTLKNSKRYRYHWGQHVRSLMGTAFEGAEQGAVRFRIEVAPSGQIAQLDTLWTTSPAVEQRARQAVQAMPPLPPTPNGKPLVFEKTIVFDAFTTETPPLYKNDCEPDPPQHGNRFVWDGRSPQTAATAEPPTEKLDPIAYAECLKQLPQDSIEAEAASDERQQKQWASPMLGR
ncbi:MAG: energy transducer TonB [Hydrogenophaga sp.]|uniref:energy transducer TonB family protein n=1 Tax=Hydrogenophaga sp. TaxID=1904254 RepID=UPI002716E251|nr:energy transducer TonB [Hydrogenophaga sp.]MDO9569782.1 energy transducer TonB [Hydrogenophaga sp.]MDP3376209.1 energy transducer TonB [Hydrogenophaga sp.]